MKVSLNNPIHLYFEKSSVCRIRESFKNSAKDHTLSCVLSGTMQAQKPNRGTLFVQAWFKYGDMI